MQWLWVFEIKKDMNLVGLCNEYYNLSKWKDEIIRIKNAQSMIEKWVNISDIPPLWVSNLHDYWYFVQLYSRDKHVFSDNTPVKLRFDWEGEVFVENFQDNNISNQWIYEKMLEIFYRKWLSFNNGPLKTDRFLSREDSDLLISSTNYETLELLWLDSNIYEIRHISIDILLRLFKYNFIGNEEIYTHVDGYRLRDDDINAALFMWHKKYGGISYIDGFWLNTSFNKLISRYMIIDKTYFKYN